MSVSENYNKRDFPASLKNGKAWAKGKPKGTMCWERDAPVLALQWVDNKVVSMITTAGNANETNLVNRKRKAGGTWSNTEVQQPEVFHMYNQYKEQQRKFPGNEALSRPASYTLASYREELVRDICELPETGAPPPSNETVRNINFDAFPLVHCPIYVDVKKACVVCVREGRGRKQVYSSCSA
ncbi:uncharacterized protein [Montipora capricornis]|uniref:uncharacterized protein n=1 Tax=Montipora capricornis TaxID=246305 RepID=UPI0035F1C296